jgi:hypothetical protein
MVVLFVSISAIFASDGLCRFFKGRGAAIIPIIRPRTNISPLLLLFFCAAISGFGQDRSRMKIYIPLPTGGTGEQRAYFQDNFKMELIGANYPVAETQDASLYSIKLDIRENPDFDTLTPASDENRAFLLGITLERSADNAEIVSFAFPFNDLESMADWNLFLLYQALANAYIPEEETPPPPPPTLTIDDRWRNKWLYLGLGAGVDSTHFVEDSTKRLFWGVVMPAASVGMDIQFSNLLSLSLGLARLRELYTGEKWVFSASVPAALKLMIKPDYTRFSNVMLGIYGGAEYSLNFGGEAPWLSAMGGVELGIKGGSRSAWTLNAEAGYSLLGKAPLADGESYSLLRFSLTAGWKLGFLDRRSKADITGPAGPETESPGSENTGESAGTE